MHSCLFSHSVKKKLKLLEDKRGEASIYFLSRCNGLKKIQIIKLKFFKLLKKTK